MTEDEEALWATTRALKALGQAASELVFAMSVTRRRVPAMSEICLAAQLLETQLAAELEAMQSRR